MWLNKETHYYLSITDSLGRQFRTKDKRMTLTEKSRVKRQILSIPLQFGKTDPMAEFYWEELFKYAKETMADTSMHLRFEGHACAIGSSEINQVLSQERANHFDAEFKEFLKSKNENLSSSMLKRIDHAIGLGESKPLTLELSTGTILLGDNASSIGRKLNRRIELVFYKNGTKH